MSSRVARRFHGALRAGISVAAVATLTGCPVGPNFVQPELNELPASYHGERARSEAASFADLPWWEVFRDPALQRLAGEAIEANYDLRMATERVVQARNFVIVARSPLLPQLNYDGLASRQRSTITNAGDTGTFNFFRGTFELAWEVDVWGRIRRATEAAEAQLLAQEEVQRGVLLTLVADLAQAYFDLLALDAQLVIARQTAASFGETLELFTNRYFGGVGSKLETARAAGALESVQAIIPELRAAIAARENQISVLLGRPPGAITRGAPLDAQRVTPEIPAGLPSALLRRRPDILQAEASVRAANAEVGVAIANFFPRLGLSAAYGAASPEIGDIVKSSGGLWAMASTLAGPLFRGGQLYGELKEQQAIHAETVLAWERAVVRALAEVATALERRRMLVLERVAREREVAAYRQSVELALDRYNAGLSNYYEVLEAQQLLFPAENQLVEARLGELATVAELYRALGGGWNLAPEAWLPGTSSAGVEDAAGAGEDVTPAGLEGKPPLRSTGRVHERGVGKSRAPRQS